MTCPKCGAPGHQAKTCRAPAPKRQAPVAAAVARPAPIRSDIHIRFRALVARAIAKADEAEAAHLAALRR